MKSWVLTLVSPCFTPGIFNLKPLPFKDETHFLHAAQIEKPWAIGDLVNIMTPANCGTFSVTFFLDDG
jgi:hypothetical protein